MAPSFAEAFHRSEYRPFKMALCRSTHAASALHASPYGKAAVMTLDGRGEKEFTRSEMTKTFYNIDHPPLI